MASSAIPLVFPAVRLHREYFGDGSVRQIAPISPAIHLGAQRILVIGVAPQRELPPREKKVQDYPSLAQVAGHLLNSVFLDAMETDLERVQRVNRTLGLLSAETVATQQTDLHPLQVLTIAPSRPLEKNWRCRTAKPFRLACALCWVGWAHSAAMARFWPAICYSIMTMCDN